MHSHHPCTARTTQRRPSLAAALAVTAARSLNFAPCCQNSVNCRILPQVDPGLSSDTSTNQPNWPRSLSVHCSHGFDHHLGPLGQNVFFYFFRPNKWTPWSHLSSSVCRFPPVTKDPDLDLRSRSGTSPEKPSFRIFVHLGPYLMFLSCLCNK